MMENDGGDANKSYENMVQNYKLNQLLSCPHTLFTKCQTTGRWCRHLYYYAKPFDIIQYNNKI